MERFVHNAEVEFLDALEVWETKLQSPVASSLEDTNNSAVINSSLDRFHQTGEKHGECCQIVADGLVHEFGVSNLCNGVQEEIVLPRWRIFHHRSSRIVVLLVLHVEVNRGFEKTSAFAGTNNLGHIEFAEENLAMIHNLLWHVLGVQNTKFCEDANMSIVQANSLLKQRNQVFEVSKVRVVHYHIVNVIGILDNFQTACGRQSELFGSQTGKANLLPGGNVVGLLCRLHSFPVLFQMDVTECQLGVVVDADEEDLRSLVQTFGETTVANCLDVGNIWSSDKLLHFGQVASLGVSVNELSVDEILLHCLACHEKVRNERGPDF
mmetsp:Transcript_20876/g.57702  ORF Transcript_20876/g.57702 Transcript_20876/m.57702 type:complete len:323 (+) Transcript_20876:774-1742(+)